MEEHGHFGAGRPMLLWRDECEVMGGKERGGVRGVERRWGEEERKEREWKGRGSGGRGGEGITGQRVEERGGCCREWC